MSFVRREENMTTGRSKKKQDARNRGGAGTKIREEADPQE
jgi:hypothetical protein